MDKLVDVNLLGYYHNNIKDSILPPQTNANQLLIYDGNSPKWRDLSEVINVEDMLSYGVSWSADQADPHLTRIGNKSMHQTLPIQSQMRGCIYNTKEKKVVYWLDDSNWYFKEGTKALGFFISNHQPTWQINKGDNNDEVWLSLNDLSIIEEYVGKRWLISVCGEYLIADTSLSGNTVILTPVSGDLSIIGSAQCPIILGMCGEGSRLDGYDGEVRVYVPEFYIKSYDGGLQNEDRWVRISTTKIDDTWEHQPASYVSAYRVTRLREVPENMGYLSTLPVNSLVSIANTSTYCRGCSNSSESDVYLEGRESDDEWDSVFKDPQRSQLGKPVTNLNRSLARVDARNAGAELLSYTQYKNIFYWLYVIEYANFNCQEEFNQQLTSDKYHQGGLGLGITHVNNIMYYTDYHQITPCGYGNSIGNNTKVKDLIVPRFDYRRSDVDHLNWVTVQEGAGIIEDGKVIITNILSSTEATIKFPIQYSCRGVTYKITGLTESGETIFFETGSPTIQCGQLSSDGTITIDWTDKNSQRKIRFSEVKSDVNIAIEIVATKTGPVYIDGQTLSMPRWRGFDNPFGDAFISLDGVIVEQISSGNAQIHITNDPAKYGDSAEDMNNMETVVSSSMPYNSYIKDFNLGSSAHIVPNSGAPYNPSIYKCDYAWVSSSGNRLYLVGGGNYEGRAYGLCSAYLARPLIDADLKFNYYTICT